MVLECQSWEINRIWKKEILMSTLSCHEIRLKHNKYNKINSWTWKWKF